MVQDFDVFTMLHQILRASHKRSYQALFLKLIIKEIAVPITPSGNQGTCRHFKPIMSNRNTGIAPIKRNNKISLLVHFSILLLTKILVTFINILLKIQIITF
jgi:hypothetical protein